MRDFYDVLIIGATFTGLGAAYKNLTSNKKILIVEKTSQAGAEFIDCYHPGTAWLQTQLSSEGEKWRQELIDREILMNNGQVHLPALAPVTYHKIKEDKLPILLKTEIVQIEKSEEGFEVELYNTSGLSKIKAIQILETSVQTRLHTGFMPNILSKSFCAMLMNESEEKVILQEWDEAGSFIQGKFDDEVILRLNIELEDDLTTARHKLHQYWEKRPEKYKAWKIAAVASYLNVVMEKGPISIQNNWTFLPSNAYLNPLEAFECGYQIKIGGDVTCN